MLFFGSADYAACIAEFRRFSLSDVVLGHGVFASSSSIASSWRFAISGHLSAVKSFLGFRLSDLIRILTVADTIAWSYFLPYAVIAGPHCVEQFLTDEDHRLLTKM